MARLRLLLDAMLGRLATYCRIAGYDTAYALDRGVEADEALLAIAAAEDRLLVTRDASLVARADRSLHIESTDIDGQLRELRTAGIELELTDPRRCGRCNGRLAPVRNGQTPDGVPSLTSEPVWRCRDCGQHYWRGSHWDDVAARLDSL